MLGAILKLMLTRGISIKRWNNFPRVEYISLLDNVGFVIHIALFLAQKEEKESWEELDSVFLIKYIIFQSFIPLVLSDINAGTKDYIKKIDPTIFSKVEKKGIEEILSIEWEKWLKDDIKETLNTKDRKKELLIIKAARKYSGLLECSVNNKIFPEIYEVPLTQIQTSLEDLKKKLPSLEKLLKNENEKKYLFNLKRLAHITRWNGKVRFLPISVMAHLVITCFITYIIASKENQKEKDSFPLLDLMLRALYHDIPEAITGDIIAPTKKSIHGFSETLEQVEKAMLRDYLFSYIKKEYEDFLRPYLFEPFHGEKGKIVKHADILSALFEAKIETISWNIREFKDISLKLYKKLIGTKRESIDYLINNTFIEFQEKHNFN